MEKFNQVINFDTYFIYYFLSCALSIFDMYANMYNYSKNKEIVRRLKYGFKKRY